MNIELLKENSSSLEELIKLSFGKEVSKIDIEDCLKKNIRFLCAKKDDDVIGSIMITTQYNPVRNTKDFYLDYVCVKEEYRNSGIGSQLLNELERIAKEENVENIILETSFPRVIAQHFYEKNNYIKKDAYIYNKVIGNDNENI